MSTYTSFSQLIFKSNRDDEDDIDTLCLLRPTGNTISFTHCLDCRIAMGKGESWSCSDSRSKDCWIEEGNTGTIYHKAYRLERK